MTDEPMDMSEFEAEVADITDPSPMQFVGYDEERSQLIAYHMGQAASTIMDDLVAVMNDNRLPLVQYLWPDGTALTAALTDAKTLHLMFVHAGDKVWFKPVEQP